ncbi:zinc finger protein 385C isoform X2 [Xenopus laevis]|uniref:Zinc finger protein 385C isoform X2 n=1 Tax=Xenopus laevis TaxID=8355 RepID=A0A8J0TZV2_XENLA|nr:zinc finger protein 385C isoform X2 [Xenopus laevis]
MKRPASLTHSTDSTIPMCESGQTDTPALELQSRREKKLPSFTLCDVCNIQLNSAVQAQIHYNGKSHQKRLKQINHGRSPSVHGAPAHGGPLLASLGFPSRPLQTHLDIKHLLTFRINGVSPLSLFPNFNAMDPVQKAVINHTFGGPTAQRRRPFISCNICHLRFNSLNQAEAHYKGHKHARKLRALEGSRHKQKQRNGSRERTSLPLLDTKRTTDSQDPIELNEISGECEEEAEHSPLPPTPEPALEEPDEECVSPDVSDSSTEPLDSAAPITPDSPGKGSEESSVCTQESEKEQKSREHLYCTSCKVTVNSTSQLEAHNAGAKHKSILEGQTTPPRRGRGKALNRTGRKPKRIGNKTSVGIHNKTFHCSVCEIHVNSETQLKQHMSSRRHRDRLSGKPTKPKYSPFSKLQRSAALVTRLALHKHLTKTLAARFLPNPMTPPTVCALPGPLTLRPATAAALFQSPLIGPALFRSPTPSLRPPPTPIMFAPY